MDKSIFEILRLYPFCRWKITDDDRTWVKMSAYPIDFKLTFQCGGEILTIGVGVIKPILRLMSAMTEEEVNKVFNLIAGNSFDGGRDSAYERINFNKDNNEWRYDNRGYELRFGINEYGFYAYEYDYDDRYSRLYNLVKIVDYLRSINIDIDNLITSGQAEAEQ